MKITAYPHKGKLDTAAAMAKCVHDSFLDLGRKLYWPLEKFFAYVKEIPYQADNQIFGNYPVREIVGRPARLLDPGIYPALDCKKKAILIASWAEGNNIPWQFVGVWESMEYSGIHHVFPILFLNDAWVIVDATLPEYKLGSGKGDIVNCEVLYA